MKQRILKDIEAQLGIKYSNIHEMEAENDEFLDVFVLIWCVIHRISLILNTMRAVDAIGTVFFLYFDKFYDIYFLFFIYVVYIL